MKKKLETSKVCELQGCDKQAREYGVICPMHYHRKYRTGTYDKIIKAPKRSISENGYVMIGGQKEHRIVYREAHGDDIPNCWGCDKPLTWDMGNGMHIDHINEVRTDNRIENLRASCISCNTRRTKRDDGVKLTAIDMTMNISSWAARPEVKVTSTCIRQRKSRGMSDYDALFTPKGTHNAV